MKQLILLLLPILFVFNAFADGELTEKERRMILKHIKMTMKSLEKSVKGLSDAQANFKAKPEAWSIKECVYHLALAEDNYWTWMTELLEASANPEKRSLVKVTDEQLFNWISSRETKVKTQEAFDPVNAKWNSLQEALDYLKNKRKEHIDFMKSTSADMHDHITEQFKLGPIDAYQIIIWSSAHTERHRQQVEEIKTAAAYPIK